MGDRGSFPSRDFEVFTLAIATRMAAGLYSIPWIAGALCPELAFGAWAASQWTVVRQYATCRQHRAEG
jgi:hypothetical protein